MDDISRELPPDETGATPVSERQKGPEELQRFELGHIGDDTDETPQFADRLAGVGVPFVAERFLAVTTSTESSSDDGGLGDHGLGDGSADVPGGELPLGDAQLESSEASQVPEADKGSLEGGEAPPEEPPGEPPEDSPAEQLVSDDDAELVDGELSSDLPPGEEDVGEDAALAAVAAESNTVELDSVDDLVDSELGEDGLPIVPDLAGAAEVARMVYVLMMTSREGMTVLRLARACNTTQKLVEEGLDLLQSQLRGIGLPVELTRVGDTVRWMSGASAFPYLQRLRGVKKLEKLSPAALETLAVVAYRQPVMRSEIEAIRGVKAGPMLRTLLQHKLVKVAGRADVPGRPLQYGTTQQFLERFGLASLQELPSVKEWKNLG